MANLFGISSCDCHEKLEFSIWHDPLLDSVCKEVPPETLKDHKLQYFFDLMFKLAKGEQGDLQKSVLVGLAAPQIGKNMRVILVDVKADGKGNTAELRLYVNPEILSFSEEMEEWYEGCYSTEYLRGIVKRPKEIQIRGLDRYGNMIHETHTGYVARIFQHEIDHLNGIRFPDRISEKDVLHIVHSNEMSTYRNSQGWRSWKNTIPQKDWREYLRNHPKL